MYFRIIFLFYQTIIHVNERKKRINKRDLNKIMKSNYKTTQCKKLKLKKAIEMKVKNNQEDQFPK